MLPYAHWQPLTQPYRLDGTAHVLGTLHPIPTGILRFSIEATWVFSARLSFKNGAPRLSHGSTQPLNLVLWKCNIKVPFVLADDSSLRFQCVHNTKRIWRPIGHSVRQIFILPDWVTNRRLIKKSEKLPICRPIIWFEKSKIRKRSQKFLDSLLGMRTVSNSSLPLPAAIAMAASDVSSSASEVLIKKSWHDVHV